MTYCRRKLSQACSKERYELIECLRHAHYVRPSPSLLDLLSLWSLRDQPRVHAYALDLSFEQSLKLIASSHGKKLKLDARAAGVDDENRVRHGSAPDRLLQLTMAKEHSHSARCHACPEIVGARGENDRDARAEHDPRRIGL